MDFQTAAEEWSCGNTENQEIRDILVRECINSSETSPCVLYHGISHSDGLSLSNSYELSLGVPSSWTPSRRTSQMFADMDEDIEIPYILCCPSGYLDVVEIPSRLPTEEEVICATGDFILTDKETININGYEYNMLYVEPRY